MPSAQQPAAQSPGGRRKKENQGGRRRFKWTRRLAFFCGWLVLMALCLAALTLVLVRVVQDNAEPLVNQARQHFAPDLPIQIGSISFPEDGVIELGDVTLSLPENDDPGATVKSVKLRIDPQTFFSDPRVKSLQIESPEVTLNQELLDLFAPDPNADPDAPPVNLSWVKVDELKITGGKLNLDLNGVPKGSVAIAFAASGIDFSRDGPLVSANPQHLTLNNLTVPDPGNDGTPLVSVEELAATIRLNKDFVSGAVATLDLKKPQVRFTPALKEAIFTPSPKGTPQLAEQKSGVEESAPMRWEIDQISMEDGFFSMAGFYDIPDISFRHTGKFTDLTWADQTIEIDASKGITEVTEEGLSWPGLQTVTLTDLRIDSGALGDDAADSEILSRAERIEITAVPDDFFSHGWCENITTQGTKIHISEDRISRFLSDAPDDITQLLLTPSDDSSTTDKQNRPAPGGDPWVIRPRNLNLADAEVTVEADGFIDDVALPQTTFTLNINSVENPPGTDATDLNKDVHYQLSATDLKVYATDSPSTPIVVGEEILAKFTAFGLQKNQRIDSVLFDHFDVRIGEEVNEIIADLSPSPEEGDPDPPDSGDPVADADETPDPLDETDDDSAEWKIGTVDLDKVKFTLEDFIPGMPFLPLEINTSLTEVPLSGRTRGDERPQQLELTQLEIAAPFNSLLPVARMNSIVLHFTIPGLIRNEIERVEIIKPELFLGEPMIWYLDNFQNVASNDAAPDAEADTEKLAANMLPSDPCAGETDEPAEEENGEGKIEALEGLANTKISGWQIKKIDATAGDLVIAPKGYPIGIVPFPFSGEADLTKGDLRLNMSVPRADYVFGELDLEFVGLYGNAFFNYPPDANNKNFVQVFNVPTIHYGDYRLDDAYLTVTFDGKLIHAEFGGWAYAGYVNGQLSITIGKKYTWEGWIAVTDVMLSPLTDALSRDSLTLTGKISGTLVSDGVGIYPNKVEGKLYTTGPCHMHVVGLDGAMKSLKEDEPGAAPNIWAAFIDPINNAISQASIGTFQRYNFTTGTANLNLVGRSGSANILLDGSDGKRKIDIDFLDKRLPDASDKTTE